MQWWTGVGKNSLILAAVAVLALSGCGSTPPSSAPPLPAPPAASGEQGGSALPQSGDGAETGVAPDPGNDPGTGGGGTIAWVPPGPVDPADPPQSQWYALLQARDCDALSAQVDAGLVSTDDGYALWSAATALCQAMYQGQEGGWAEAADGLASLQQPGPDRCLDRAAYDLIAAWLAFHALNPGAVPSPAEGSGTACPLGLTGLIPLDVQGSTDLPSSGLAGGSFQLAGRFQDVVAVMVGDQRVPVEADPNQAGKWIVLIPAAASAGTVELTVESSAGMLPGSLTFTYVDDGALPPESVSPESVSPEATPGDSVSPETTPEDPDGDLG